MMCFSAGYVAHQQAHLIGIGLTDADLYQMLVQQKPIHLKSEQFALPEPGFDLVIYATKDHSGVNRYVLEIANNLFKELAQSKEDYTISCLVMAEQYYLLPLMSEGGRGLYAIGLTEELSFPKIRKGNFFPFRSRGTSDVTNVLVQIYWAASDEFLEENLYRSGIISRHTALRKVT